MDAYATEHGFSMGTNEGAVGDADGPKFSHAWVVGGRKSGTGAAVLVSDPQTPVRDPSLWMELHVSDTQWVPFHDVDAALTVCPIGHSDRPDSPWRKSTLALWSEVKLHPAPLARLAMEKIATTRRSWDRAKP